MNQLAGLWSYDNVSMINILNIENSIFRFKLLPSNILAVKFMQIVFFLNVYLLYKLSSSLFGETPAEDGNFCGGFHKQ